MTLIVGFVCAEGIGLVSDTKITDPTAIEPEYASKILTPLAETPFIVGAAGFTDLFLEFNRKIPEIVAQRIRQYKVLNTEQLIKTGLSREEAIQRVKGLQKTLSKSQQQVVEEEKEKELTESEIELPFVYTAENFLDDCKQTIKEISTESGYSNPIELLIGLRKDTYSFPRLFRIDARGREENITKFTAIGSGEPHAKIFFDREYAFDKPLDELVKHAFRSIAYVQEVVKDTTVGYDYDHPPEAVMISSIDGEKIYGRIPYTNMANVLNEIKEEMNNLDKIIRDSSISNLDER